jgi:hypothetical protein
VPNRRPRQKNRSQRLTLTAKQTDIAIKQATRRAALADNTNSINAKK